LRFETTLPEVCHSEQSDNVVMAKILIVDDDASMAEGVVDWLEHEGHTADHALDAEDAKSLLEFNCYDVIILDVGLPGKMSGFDLCQYIRAQSIDSMILLLTGRQTINDKVTGLEYGADDYMTKPFDLRELTARLHALTRRSRQKIEEVLTYQHFALDTSSHTLRVAGNIVHLYRKEFSILEHLMRHPEQVISSEVLIKSIWPASAAVSAENVRTCIARIRRATDVPGLPKLIQTVPGLGYRLSRE
jgi:DNA-binding response OmpR family regulator